MAVLPELGFHFAAQDSPAECCRGCNCFGTTIQTRDPDEALLLMKELNLAGSSKFEALKKKKVEKLDPKKQEEEINNANTAALLQVERALGRDWGPLITHVALDLLKGQSPFSFLQQDEIKEHLKDGVAAEKLWPTVGQVKRLGQLAQELGSYLDVAYALKEKVLASPGFAWKGDKIKEIDKPTRKPSSNKKKRSHNRESETLSLQAERMRGDGLRRQEINALTAAAQKVGAINIAAFLNEMKDEEAQGLKFYKALLIAAMALAKEPSEEEEPSVEQFSLGLQKAISHPPEKKFVQGKAKGFSSGSMKQMLVSEKESGSEKSTPTGESFKVELMKVTPSQFLDKRALKELKKHSPYLQVETCSAEEACQILNKNFGVQILSKV